MRILYLTSGFPYPLTSGRLRHYFLIRELARRHEVTLLSLVGREHGPDDRAALEPYTARLLTVAAAGRPSRLGRVADRLARVAGRGDVAVRRLAETAARLVGDGSIDIACFSGRRTEPAVWSLGRVPLVVDLCDATSLQVRGHLRVAGPAQLPGLATRYALARRVEQALIRRADHVLFASVRDQEAILGDRTDIPATILPNGVDSGYWRRAAPTLGRDVVFSGAMDYPPNADAARMLLDVIMPLVWRERPETRVAIVGRDPAPDLMARGRRPRVIVTGYVEDVRPYLDTAAVFVAPLRFAAGIQNKVLEAMAMEVPVVTTPVAAAGLWAGVSPPLAIAEEPAELAARIIERLRAAASDPAPDPAARRYVERHFEWDAIGRTLDAVVTEAAAGRRTRG